MRDIVRSLIIFIITAVLGYLLLYTGIWPIIIIAGIVSSLIGERFTSTLISSFIGGIIASLLFLLNYLALGGQVGKMAYYAGAVAGFPGTTFLLFTFLISGIYCLLGSIIGIYIKKIFM
ncbi:MAG: hypothetical protein ACP5I6_05810 [Caldisphaera sp.]|jgi:hypothetical protein